MSEPLPPLDALRCFTEAARLLNFRAAARAVGLTPAALGQRIRQLEDLMEVRLFHRTTRSVALTEQGAGLLPFAQKALAAASDCVRAGRGEVGPPAIELVLGTRHELGLSWVLPLLPRLRQVQSGLSFHVYFGSGPDLVHRVRAAQIDCAVTSSLITDPKLDTARLHEERYVFVGRPELIRARPLSRPEHAAKHTLIDVAPDLPLFRYWRDGEGGQDVLPFGSITRLGTIAAIRALVLAGEGVAVLPEYFVQEDLRAKQLIRLFPKVKLLSDYFRLVYRGDDPKLELYQRLAQVMLSEPLR